MANTFKKGTAVSVVLIGFGEVTREESVVLRTDKKGVWLDNGPGNDPSGPYDASSGRYLGPCVPGFSQSIETAPLPVPARSRPKP